MTYKSRPVQNSQQQVRWIPAVAAKNPAGKGPYVHVFYPPNSPAQQRQVSPRPISNGVTLRVQLKDPQPNMNEFSSSRRFSSYISGPRVPLATDNSDVLYSTILERIQAPTDFRNKVVCAGHEYIIPRTEDSSVTLCCGSKA